jgi:hypothetical protein
VSDDAIVEVAEKLGLDRPTIARDSLRRALLAASALQSLAHEDLEVESDQKRVHRE